MVLSIKQQAASSGRSTTGCAVSTPLGLKQVLCQHCCDFHDLALILFLHEGFQFAYSSIARISSQTHSKTQIMHPVRGMSSYLSIRLKD